MVGPKVSAKVNGRVGIIRYISPCVVDDISESIV